MMQINLSTEQGGKELTEKYFELNKVLHKVRKCLSFGKLPEMSVVWKYSRLLA